MSIDPKIRRRHTFLFEFDDANSIDQFYFSDDGPSLRVEQFSGKRHDRITVPLEAQDEKLEKMLNSVNKLHVTWCSERPFDYNAPFNIVREPGWHINVDEGTNWNEVDSLFDIVIGSNNLHGAPISTPNWQSVAFSGDFVFKEHSPFVSLLSRWYSLQDLSQISSFSLSYGYTPSNPNPNQRATDMIIEIYWSKLETHDLIFDESNKDISDKVEIGMLSVNPTYTQHNVWAMSGLIRSLGSPPEKTFFNYSPKHIQLASSLYHANFKTPIGLHPEYDLQLTNIVAPQPICKLYAKFTIPNDLFLDQYQLADLDRSIAGSATGKLLGVWGETDLEDPVWSVSGWGSEALIEIYTPPASHFKSNFSFALPMHSRYEFPQSNTTVVTRLMEWPVVFWACKDLESRVNNDVVGLSYESLFPEDTLFYHLTPSFTDSFLSEFTIPVAPLEVYNNVSHTTVMVIISGFLFLLYKIIVRFLRLHKKPVSRQKID